MCPHLPKNQLLRRFFNFVTGTSANITMTTNDEERTKTSGFDDDDDDEYHANVFLIWST